MERLGVLIPINGNHDAAGGFLCTGSELAVRHSQCQVCTTRLTSLGSVAGSRKKRKRQGVEGLQRPFSDTVDRFAPLRVTSPKCRRHLSTDGPNSLQWPKWYRVPKMQ